MTESTDLLTLFSRPGCHLCEEALEMIEQLNLKITLTESDITEDPGLEQRYGVAIPVLRHDRSERELAWPFGPEDVKNLIVIAAQG
jgi:glutaredoxin